MYETIFVIDSLLKSEEIDSIITKYERFISANGGQIDATERWGKKRLAYEIKKRQYGYYVLIRFDGPPTMIKPLEREYRLNESLLRFKTLVMPQLALKHLETVKQDNVAETTQEEATTPVEAAPEATPQSETPATETTEAPTEESTVETEPETTEEAAQESTEEAAANEEEKKSEA